IISLRKIFATGRPALLEGIEVGCLRSHHNARPGESRSSCRSGAAGIACHRAPAYTERAAKMPINVIVVDDEKPARDELIYLLKGFQEVSVIGQGKNGVEALALIKEHSPDLVFLDVQMPGLDGFGVLKKLVERKMKMPHVVFATAFDQYAVKAFEVNAVDYVLKPFDKKRVVQSVQKVRTKMEAGNSSSDKLETLVRMLESQKPQASKILIKAAGRLFLFNQKDIGFASIEEGVITVVTSRA